MALIIGGAGAVGKRLIGGLAGRGDAVAVVLRRTPLPDHLQTIVVGWEMNTDVRNPDTLRRAFRQLPQIDVVWNLAAPLSIETALDPDAAFNTVVGGMRNIIDVCKEFKVPKLLFTDSIGSFGSTAPRLDCTARWLTENPTQDPRSDYGRQKRACRELMAQFESDGGDARWAVLPGVLHSESAWGNGTTEYALSALLAAAEGRKFECPIDPDVQLPMIFVDDLIRGMLALQDAPKEKLLEPESGYCLPGLTFTANELFEEIRKHEPDFETTVNLDANMNLFAGTWPDTLSGAEPMRDLGYKPRVDLPQIVTRVLRAHRARMQSTASLPELATISAP
mmetsp:Transcript_109265/g.189591  ORF Transcript_109265/g.189591 Transcript_109265/m.189591 type:complete len:336 (-) Transcript_109265:32-1039(-)